MIATIRNWVDEFLGRGQAAITVPVMDGTLKPNRILDRAEVALELADIDDLASDGAELWVCAGKRLGRLVEGRFELWREFAGEITALAAHPSGRIAVAIDGRTIQILGRDGAVQAELSEAGGRALGCANALAFEDAQILLITEGSQVNGTGRWVDDLMQLGASGRVIRWNVAQAQSSVLAKDLGYAFGALALGGRVLVSESWRHRVRSIGPTGATGGFVAELPCYPSRMAPAADGGLWLTAFVCRTQLVEFVLRERAYRTRMMSEIDPRYWIAPSLSSGKSFLEPLQGAGVKNMGVLKPWAPPRSYGLVMRLSPDGRILASMHSQVDGTHHGCTAAAEHQGQLYVVSKGSQRLLRVDLERRNEQ
jgi:hypothetical protein